jgi:DNA polymerase III epsilon subunit-like protein
LKSIYITKDGQVGDAKDLFIVKNLSDNRIELIKEAPADVRQRLALEFVDDVFDTIRDWLDSCDYIVGHNILGFDFYLIKEMYLLKGLRANHLVNKILDTNCLAKGIKYGIPKMSKETLIEYQYKLLHTYRKGIKTNLTALGKDYNIDHDYDNLHNAIVDLDLNLKVWNKIKFQVEI